MSEFAGTFLASLIRVGDQAWVVVPKWLKALSCVWILAATSLAVASAQSECSFPIEDLRRELRSATSQISHLNRKSEKLQCRFALARITLGARCSKIGKQRARVRLRLKKVAAEIKVCEASSVPATPPTQGLPPLPSPTVTPIDAPVLTPSATVIFTSTPTRTSTSTSTATYTATATSSNTSTATPSPTLTATETATATYTATATSTNTATATPSATATETSTFTPTATSTSTPTPTQTAAPPPPSGSACLIPESRLAGTAPNAEVSFSNGRLALTVSRPGGSVALIHDASAPLVSGTSATIRTEVQAATNGADVLITIANSSITTVALGTIYLGGIDLGRNVRIGDFRHGSEFDDVDLIGTAEPGATWYENSQWNGGEVPYPDDLFSPVAVLSGNGYTIGMSLQYPVMEYRHFVKFRLQRPRGEAAMRLKIMLAGDLAPGESRSYVLSVRVVEAADSWLKTLLPYRNFFRVKYGGVDFVRDPRPIAPIIPSFVHLQSSTNPYGYQEVNGTRPDINGWAGWAQQIRTYHAWGYERALMWPLSGLYQGDAADYNYPFLMLTPLRQTPIRWDTLGELSQLPQEGLQLGFYQGYGTRYHTTWENPCPHPFIQNNPCAGQNIVVSNSASTSRAFDEIDIAYQLGGSLLGLDAAVLVPLWDVMDYVDVLRNRYPGMRFIGEVSPSDIFARQNISYLSSPDIRGPHVLADFLLPGHETLVSINFQNLYGQSNVIVPIEFFLRWVRQYAQWGYVPMPLDYRPLPDPGDYRAVESWRTTVPSELQDPCLSTQ